MPKRAPRSADHVVHEGAPSAPGASVEPTKVTDEACDEVAVPLALPIGRPISQEEYVRRKELARTAPPVPKSAEQEDPDW